MIKNYIKIAWRNLWRNKFFSTINIFGLALGMACSVLILLWVQNELSVDAYHVNGPRLYTVIERQYYDGKVVGQYSLPGVLADQLKKDIPEVQLATGFESGEKNTFQVGNKILKIEGAFAGADLFKMFSYPLLQGKAETALSTISDMAISRKMAEDFFGSPQAAIGKTIKYENKQSFTVTAVFENLPQNSSIKFEYVINWFQYLKENDWAKSWGNNGPSAFVMLRGDAKPALVDKKLTHYLDAYNKEQSKGFREELGIQKYSDVYLHADLSSGKPDGGRIEYVNIFILVAIFILLIACINFMNLTTARSVKRAKEIGVRKVVGAVRGVLIRQFIGEAVLLTFIAVVVALLLVTVLLPTFNSVTQKQIDYPFASLSFWFWLVLITAITGLVSGSYPALFLSAFNPTKVLKGSVKMSSGANWFRKGLVVFQFILSVVLIIGTIVVSKQVNFIQTRNLGYDRENLIYIPLEGDLTAKYELFKDMALKGQGVQMVTRITNTPTNFGSSTIGVNWDGKDPNSKVMFTQVSVGYDFTPTLKLKMASGRDYSRAFATDTNNYIINEVAAKKIGYANPINKPLTMWGKNGRIVGVVKDFHFRSLHEPIQPLIIRLRENEVYGNIMVRTKPGQTKQALATVEKLCKTLNPEFTFTYSFSDEAYQKLYNNEQIVSSLCNAFAFLAIFISCLGLLGLAMFTAEQRVKEIGIRKVLGASLGSLFALLSKEFLILVIVALGIASPLAWWLMRMWLEGYSYRTTIDWWVFALSAVLAILIALITVSFQSAKVALLNPVKNLRSE